MDPITPTITERPPATYELTEEQAGGLLWLITKDNESGVTLSLPENVELKDISAVTLIKRIDNTTVITVKFQ